VQEWPYRRPHIHAGLFCCALFGALGGGGHTAYVAVSGDSRELSDWLSAKHKNDSEWLLHELTRPLPAALKEVNLVCLPHGGGSAILYQTPPPVNCLRKPPQNKKSGNPRWRHSPILAPSRA